MGDKIDVKIGNNNKIKNSSIGNHYESNGKPSNSENRKSFAEKHPILIGVIISMVTGFVLLFSFWDHLVDWIEGLFS
ncbi:hypothetical protein [Paenibacillus cineris]|uniref:Uncharacterized protein n=1 Tax=Paenibacillus cineris TaxID=237530 RepID=A0ABQ4LN88_9BACL|nr:hypothetical protein [Paenibacillus cineris]GIO57984.1 hypothetical protein J21TS7_63020 [Paenibacillus cineris]